MPGSAVPSTTPLHPSMKRIPLTSLRGRKFGSQAYSAVLFLNPASHTPFHQSTSVNTGTHLNNQDCSTQSGGKGIKMFCWQITKKVEKDEGIKEMHYDSCLSHGERMRKDASISYFYIGKHHLPMPTQNHLMGLQRAEHKVFLLPLPNRHSLGIQAY